MLSFTAGTTSSVPKPSMSKPLRRAQCWFRMASIWSLSKIMAIKEPSSGTSKEERG
jgi:hypothetical protein